MVVVKPRLKYVVDFAGWKVCRLRHEARTPLPEVPQGNCRSMEDSHQDKNTQGTVLNVTDPKLLVRDPNPFVLGRDVLFPFASAGYYVLLEG